MPYSTSGFSRKLAILSLIAAGLHFLGETFWYFKFGQFLPMLIVDYIAISLLIFGAVRVLQTPNAIGLLCGAWGFTFCLNYRSLFWRVERIMYGDEAAVASVGNTAHVLAVLLCISFLAFAVSLYLSNPKSN